MAPEPVSTPLVSPTSVPVAASSAADPEAALVARARAGELGAFEALYRRHGGRIFALCLRMSGDGERGRELAHDVFVRAWEKLASFRGDSSFGTWLHRLAVNVVLEQSRSERRRRLRFPLARDMDDGDGDVIDDAPTPVAADPDARIDLEHAIARLPPAARRVFVLHDVSGYRHGEIARALDIAEGTVRAHLHRARHLLMEWLSR